MTCKWDNWDRFTSQKIIRKQLQANFQTAVQGNCVVYVDELAAYRTEVQGNPPPVYCRLGNLAAVSDSWIATAIGIDRV